MENNWENICRHRKAEHESKHVGEKIANVTSFSEMESAKGRLQRNMHRGRKREVKVESWEYRG
jgi:hypothetical protein